MCFKLTTASIGEPYHTLIPVKRLIEVDTGLGVNYELRVAVSVDWAKPDVYSFRYFLVPGNAQGLMKEMVTEIMFSMRSQNSNANLASLVVVDETSVAWILAKTVESTFKHVMGLGLFYLPETL